MTPADVSVPGPPVASDGRPTRRLLAILFLGVITLVATVVVAVGLLSAPSDQDLLFTGTLYVGLWLYLGLGALIVARSDGHLVGWLFAVAAAMVASAMGCFAIGFQLISSQPSDPLGAWFGLVGYLLVSPGVILALPAVALTFPTGTLPGPRWRWPVRVVVAMATLQVLAVMIRPGPLFDDGGPINPLTRWLPSVSPAVIEVLRTLEAMGNLAMPLGAALGVIAIVVRFRRSEGDERQQLKWFLAATAPAAVMIPLGLGGITASLPLVDLLGVATLSLIPASVAVAILRYRLYEIDRFISRTISYGLVTALLVALFLLVNLGLQSVLSSVTSGNSLAVAGSTLLAAALFTPVRRRVQRMVDRRFDRARYDGERTASAFSVRMRDATDLPTVAKDLDVTVRRAMAPSSVGLWLREGGR